MKKLAFTILELIFVLIVIGILSIVFIPKFGQNKLSQAANQVVSDIRYTEHLAMTDDDYNATDSNWYKKRWQISFNSDAYTYNKEAYTIFRDKNANAQPTLTLGEVAKNPSDPSKFMTGGYTGVIYSDGNGATKKMNLGLTYGVTSVQFSSSCSYYRSQRISFDHLGRPLRGSPSGFTAPYKSNRLIASPCDINISRGSHSTIVRIEPETGYVHIL